AYPCDWGAAVSCAAARLCDPPQSVASGGASGHPDGTAGSPVGRDGEAPSGALSSDRPRANAHHLFDAGINEQGDRELDGSERAHDQSSSQASDEEDAHDHPHGTVDKDYLCSLGTTLTSADRCPAQDDCRD